MFTINNLFSVLHSFLSKKALRHSVLTLSAAIALSSSFALTVNASADINDVPQWPDGPSVTAEAAILMEAETGTILYSKNIHKQEYPASCTKILTCIIAAERCELDELVYLSHDAVYDTPRGSNHIALDVGEAITMEQALSAILIRSANEVSFAVGEHISGTTWQDFGAIMNEKAKELGALNSNFVNPNGLPDENHYTTAYDLATIARTFFDNELLAKLSRTTKLDIPASDLQPDHIIEHTKNRLLAGQKYAYKDLVGSKTGYTDAARNCLVSCAEKDGLKLICVVLRDGSPDHYTDTISLFDWGFSNFKAINVSESETKYHINESGLFYSDNDIFGSSAPLLELNSEDFIVLPNTATFEETVSSISYDTNEDDVAALITYTWNGVEVGTATIDFTANALNDAFVFDAVPPAAPDSTDETQTEATPDSTDGTQTEAAPDSRNDSLFGKIWKVVLIVLCIVLLCAIVFVVTIHIRNYRMRLARSRHYYSIRQARRSGVTCAVSYRPIPENLERRRSVHARKSRIHRHKRSKRPNRFRDYDF